MANLREVKTKIGSTKNLKKITNALEIVSTVKMKKNKAYAESLTVYMMRLYEMIVAIGGVSMVQGEDDRSNASATQGDKSRTLLIVVTTDRGLAGSMNSMLLKYVDTMCAQHKATTDIFVIGKKGHDFFTRNGYNVVGHLSLPDTFDENDVAPLLTYLNEKNHSYRSGSIVFNYFKNVMTQVPTMVPLFPITKELVYTFTEQIGNDPLTVQKEYPDQFVEPSRRIVREEIWRQLRTFGILSALVQNKVGEHAARMIAMKNAKDNASNLIDDLTLAFNKLRQAMVTQEISEIVSAKAAIDNG